MRQGDEEVKIQSALEKAGVEFLPADDAHGPGVRLKLPRGRSPSEIKPIGKFDNGSLDNGSAAIVDRLMRMQTALKMLASFSSFSGSHRSSM